MNIELLLSGSATNLVSLLGFQLFRVHRYFRQEMILEYNRKSDYGIQQGPTTTNSTGMMMMTKNAAAAIRK